MTASEMPTRSYWLCTTPRTGGSLLCQLLDSTGVAGHPQEFFWRDNEPAYRERWQVSTYSDYLACALREGTTPNGVFGVKLDIGIYLAHFESQLRALPVSPHPPCTLQTMANEIFPQVKFIWLTRRNKVRQAISWWKAVQTNEWGRHAGDAFPVGPVPEYNFAAIDQLASESLMREAAWQALFSDWQVTPLTIVYEDFVLDQIGTVAHILDFLGVREPYTLREEVVTLVQQADGLSEEWVQQYREEKQQGWTNRAW